MCNYTKTRLRVLKNRRGLTSEEFEAKLRRHFRLYMWPRLCVQMFLVRSRTYLMVPLPKFAENSSDEERVLAILSTVAVEKCIPPDMVLIAPRTKFNPHICKDVKSPSLIIKLV